MVGCTAGIPSKPDGQGQKRRSGDVRVTSALPPSAQDGWSEAIPICLVYESDGFREGLAHPASYERSRDLPDGLSGQFSVQPLLQKYFSSRTGRSSSRGIAVPHLSEGRFAIVTDVGWGMRWTWSRQATNDVDSRTVKSCGSDSSTLESNR
jgi:hypothetical protein